MITINIKKGKRDMKKFTKTLLVTSMLVGQAGVMFPINAVEDSSLDFIGKLNYAIDGTASAYTSPISYWGPDKLNDGIINRDADKPDQSRWSSEVGAPGWVKIDLKEAKTFNEFLLAFENSKVKAFHIETSDDDENYTTIYTSETKDDGHNMDTTVKLDEAVTARYVKLTIDSLISGAYPSVSMYEFEIIGDAEFVNFAPESSAAASDVEPGTSFTADKTIDSDLTTRWSGQDHTQKTLTYTFAEEKTLRSLILEWERRNPTAYHIQVDDNGEWKTIYDGKKPKKFTDKVILDKPYVTTKVRVVIDDFVDEAPKRDGQDINYPTVSLLEVEMFDLPVPADPEYTVDDVAAEIKEASLNEDGTALVMPKVPEGYTIDFIGADYEQILTHDMTVIKPLTAQDVVVNFEVTEKETGKKAVSPAITVTIPGIYDEAESQNAKPVVIPELQQWFGETGVFEIKDTSRIVVNPSAEAFMDAANKFAADYLDVLDKNIEVVVGTEPQAGDFYFTLSDEKLDKETYVMDIDDYVTVEASENTGAYWSTRTILQILKQNGTMISKGITKDYPKYEVRGFMLDVARRPFKMDFLKELVKTMSWYKLSDFHVHLSDNVFGKLPDKKTPEYSGFRLESDVPNLTNTDLFYTKDEFRDFIKSSKEVGVNIVPEFDTPGHSGAFVRARPDLARADSNEYLDVENPEALEFVKSVFAEYTSGDDPVFPKGTVVHIGTDEYKRGNKEAFRVFQDELLKFMRDEQGYTPRVWGSQTENSGTTPITVDGVQMNLWYVGYANPREMYEKGYKCVNSNDGDLYIVPGAGYYYDYLNQDHIANSWQPNRVGNFTIPVGDDQMLGSTFHVWNDKTGPSNDNGTSDVEVFDRIFHILPTFSAKLWGDIKDYSTKDINELTETIKYAPNSNPAYEVETKGNRVLDYNLDNAKGLDKSGNEFNLISSENIDYVAGKNRNALSLKGGSSYVETPVEDLGLNSTLEFWVKRDSASTDEEQVLFESENGAIKAVQKDTGKFGFSREFHDYSFDYELPKDEWVKIKLETKLTVTTLYVNGEKVDELSRSGTGGKWASLVIPLERIGSKTNAFVGLIDDVKVNKKQKEISKFVNAYATSQHPSDAATNAIDGNPNTMWHTKWNGDDVLPQSITLELPNVDEIKGFTYLPRQAGVNGFIKDYTLEVSTDGENFTEVAAGKWAEDAVLKTVDFAPCEAKYIRLTANEGVGGWASAAELDVIFVKMHTDKRALTETVSLAQDLLKGNYTPETIDALQEVLEEATVILANEAATQEDVDAANVALQMAIDNLQDVVVEEADKTALQIAIEMAETVTDEDLANVLPVVVKEFKAALQEAKEVYANGQATQDAVNDAFDRLANAMHMLDFFKGDKAALQKLFDKVTGLDKDAYLPNTWDAFVAAYNNADAVLANENAMQDEVNETYDALIRAFLNLRLKPNKDLLNDLINKAQAVDEANYTAETYAVLNTVLQEAKAVFENENATETEVVNAQNALTKALAGLVSNKVTPVNPGDKAPSVSTGDSAMPALFASLGGLSLLGLVYNKKRKARK